MGGAVHRAGLLHTLGEGVVLGLVRARVGLIRAKVGLAGARVGLVVVAGQSAGLITLCISNFLVVILRETFK